MGMLLDLALQTGNRCAARCVDPDDPLMAAAEPRRLQVLAMLRERPGTMYAVLTDIEEDPQAIILAFAIRDVGTCELRIPREKWDGVLFLEMLERHTVH